MIPIDLVKPDTRIGVGRFKADTLDMLLERPLAHILQPHMRASVFERPGQDGALEQVYPLKLTAEGKAVGIHLGKLGALWFGVSDHLLWVEAPLWMEGLLKHAAGSRVVDTSSTREAIRLYIHLQEGDGIRMPIKGIGYLGLEVPNT